MTITADFWHLVGLLLGFLAVCGGAGGVLLRQSQRHLDERFDTQEKSRATAEAKLSSRLDAIEQVNRDETIQWQRVEREMLINQADLPMRYVMREDYIRSQTTIDAKLDAIALRIDNSHLRTQLNGKN